MQKQTAVGNVLFVANLAMRAVEWPMRFALAALLGRKCPYSRAVRLTVGLGFMGLGVSVAHASTGDSESLRMVADGVGYFLHGMGLTPWLATLTDLLDDGQLTPEA
jgi:hypothetical protein